MDNIDKEQKQNTLIYKLDTKLRCAFTINHSAEPVKYDMKEFVERNVDVIASVLDSAMKEKADEYVSCIYQNILSKDEEIDKASANMVTIWSKFSAQMDDLMDELAERKIKLAEEKQKPV